MAPVAISPERELNDRFNGFASSEPNDYGVTPTPSDGSDNGDGTLNFAANTGFVPMAICGMACRLPGGVNSPQELWDFLINKKDARSDVPESRYSVEGWYSEKEKPGTVRVKHGYFLDNDPFSIDSSFFTMTQAELERCDPQQRQLLEVAREVVEDAGVINWRGSRTGVWVGALTQDWNEATDRDPLQYGINRVVGYGDFGLSNRISYEMDLQGPSVTIGAACAASMISLHDACLAINNGDCEAAIVGGVHIISGTSMTVKMSELGALSPDGSCKTFSADANGYVRAEACNAIYIKPLVDAIRDGNPVRAVIRSAGTGHNGKTPGITSPGGEAQEKLIRLAYQRAGITDLSETAFVEAHGTGTQAGDSIEAKALGRVFGDKGVHITSIKPNFGHSEGASGLTSVIKSVLALEHKVIPPNIKFTTPSPKIPFESMKLTVPVKPTPWPAGRKERVSINNFGIGGSNAHVILESASCFNAAPVLEEASDFPQLLLYSANTADALTQMIENYSTYLAKNPDRIEDLAYTLSTKREYLPHRAFVVASREKPGAPSPPTKPIEPPNVVMVFTGQGAQWPQMGRGLMRSNANFKAAIKLMDAHLKSLGENAPAWSIEAELRKPAKTSKLHLAELSQPICTAVQVALVDCLTAVGIVPAAVVGHSSGEIAAAYAAGALTAEQAITAAFQRGAVTKKQQRKGAMAAIGMGSDDVEPFLVPNVGVACENSHKSVTLSGDADKIEEVVAAISRAKPDVLARLLKVEKAYHSYHMAEIGEDYYQMVGPKMFGAPTAVPFFSSVTGEILEEGKLLGSRYWQSNLENPVLFRSAVLSILDHPVGKNVMFLEVGPHSALGGPLRQILSERSSSAPYVSALTRGQDSTEALLSALGKLYTLHVPLDFRALYPVGTTLTDLPRYPWNHSVKHMYETRAAKEWRTRPHAHHDLLGVKTLECTDYEPAWRNLLHLDNAPWLRDHQIGNDTVFPFAGYIAMAGEAIRQVTGVQEGFKIREARAKTALVMSEGAPIELITTLRRHRLTDSQDSGWWDFTVGSYNGHTWTKHCAGQVTAMPEIIGTALDDGAELPRSIDTKKWYQTVRSGGNMYGPQFQCLDHIKTSTVSPGRATARVPNSVIGDEENYHLHPTILDSALQLLLTASALGMGINFKNNVASSVKEMSISRCYTDLKASVSASFTGPRGLLGNGEYTSNGQVVMRMKDFASTILGGSTTGDKHAAARHVWHPDVEFQDTEDLLKPSSNHLQYATGLKELLQLCLANAKCSIEGTAPTALHLQQYKTWLLSTEPKVEEAGNLEPLIQSQAASFADTPAFGVAQAMMRISMSIAQILSNEVEVLDVLAKDELLNKVQTFVSDFDISELLLGLGHSKPDLRVLELGAGTGSSTTSILRHLAGSFSKYTFTDVSSNLFGPVREQFKDVRNIEYLSLDVNQSLEEQGFGEREFDLIIANNVVVQTEDVSQSLGNIQKLLHPQGRLLLQELSPSSTWAKFILGSLPSWWRCLENGRGAESKLNAGDWEQHLLTNKLTIDMKAGDSISSVLVARPEAALTASKQVTLLHTNAGSGVSHIEQKLRVRGYIVTASTIDDIPPSGQDIISVLDIDGPFFQGLTETSYNKFQAYINNIENVGIFWITSLSSLKVQDPTYGAILGFARTIRNETGLDFAVCQADFNSDDDRVFDVFEKFQTRQSDAVYDPEMEWAVVDGEVSIGRLEPHSLADELLIAEPNDKTILTIDRPGRLEGLHWERHVAEPAQADQVEIEVHATGLSDKDVQVATGADSAASGFGLDAAGIVVHTGPEVKNLQIGDRVMVLARNAFSSTITVSESLCTKMPFGLDFTDAATMPLAFSVALYSLIDVAQLQKDQSVLIHSAASGVGLAAVQVANMIGAEVYATTSSEEGSNTLISKYNVQKDHIFNSRDVSFANDIKRATDGRGVDVVLNSLAGELLHASWHCVAEFGQMVEIGKKDASGAAKLDMDVFLLNRRFAYVDMERIKVAKPTLITKLLDTIATLYSEGKIKPLSVAKTFDATEVQDAFSYMQQNVHPGKVVVEASADISALDADSGVAERLRVAEFDSSASYLLVGGLGGIGRTVSIWMVEHGARNLIYLSRSAGDKVEDQQLVSELKSMGCSVQLVKGSVTNSADVVRAIMTAATSPLKGVIQMSMVLRDRLWADMSWEDWQAATAPKIEGTWNLHNATVEADLTLDFFVCFSSITGVIGNKGQANYAAANTFLDSFCQYRNSLGLAATSIDLGVVEDVGAVSNSAELLNTFRAQGFLTLKEQEVIDALTLATSSASSKVERSDGAFVHPNTFVLGLGSTVPLNSDKSRAVWRRDPRMAIYHNGSAEASSGAPSDDDLKSFLAAAKADPAVLKTVETEQRLATEIGRRLKTLLMQQDDEVNISLGLGDLGMDSLIAIDMRQWWRQTFGSDISVLEMLGSGTLEVLGKRAAEDLSKGLEN